MTEVTFPEMRAEVVGAVRALADPAYQQRVWIDRDFPTETYFDDFTANVHILYDDCVVLPDPTSRVETILLAAEVEPLSALGLALTPLLDDLGDADDATYLADPRWPEVVAAATGALAVMEPGGREQRSDP